MKATNTVINFIPSTENTHPIDYKISTILRQLGISPKHVGYNYLKMAIRMVYENPIEYSTLITKRLYPDIACTFGTKSKNIERGIRYSICSIKCSDNTKEEIIGYASDNYTNKEFISGILEALKYME